MPKLRHFLLLICGWISLSSLEAHQIDAVEFNFHSENDQWRLNGMMDLGYMLPGIRGDPDARPPGQAVVAKASPAELAKLHKQTEDTLRKILVLKFADREIPWRIEFPEIKNEFLPEEAEDWALLPVILIADARKETGDFEIHWQDDLGAELIINLGGGENGLILSAPPGDDLLLFHVREIGEAEKPQTAISGLTGWLRSGIRHVIPLGLDHMLFILGLFLLLPKWKPLLGQSLLFTVAHSITLSLAVFGLVRVPSQLVEVLIAASIAWIGIENLIVKKLGKQRFILIFAFGLLHGLGFASVLAEKLGGVPKSQMVVPLVGFNLGVEIAQVSLLCAAFLLLIPLKKWTPQIQKIGSVGIALAGLFWMVERLM